MRKQALILFTLMTLPLAASALPAGAGTQGMPAVNMAPPTAEKLDVSEQEVQEFAKIYVESANIRKEYQAKLIAEKDPKKTEELKKEGREKLRAVVQESPLSTQRYNKIAKATTRDKDLKQRIVAAIKNYQSENSAA